MKKLISIFFIINSIIFILNVNVYCLTVDVTDPPYNAIPNDENDDSVAIQNAINAVQNAGSGIVFFPVGIYEINNTLNVTEDGVRLVGESRGDGNHIDNESKGSRLIMRKDDMSIINLSASYGGIENLFLSGRLPNGEHKTGVTAINLTPKNLNKPVYQNYNMISNIFIQDCEFGISLQCGITKGSGNDQIDSGCWYNVFDNILITNTATGIFFRNPVQGGKSGANRNQFYSNRIGNEVSIGIRIDAGDTNTFLGCSFEGITTAIYIFESSSIGLDNNHNTFISAKFEKNIKDVANYNKYTEFYGSNIGYTTGKFAGVDPLVLFGGNDQSNIDTIFPGYNKTLKLEMGLNFGSIPQHDAHSMTIPMQGVQDHDSVTINFSKGSRPNSNLFLTADPGTDCVTVFCHNGYINPINPPEFFVEIVVTKK